LRSSSIFPDRWLVSGVAALMTVGAAPRAAALDPGRAMSQYITDSWKSDRGFPGGAVHGITQTGDGYLWIATEKGLVRFDGLAFRQFSTREVAPGAGPAALGLVSGQDGSLWARLQGPGLVRYHDGGFENVQSSLGPPALVTAMFRARDGSILVAVIGEGVMAHGAGGVQTIATLKRRGSSFVIALAETPAGEVWLGTRDAGLLRVVGQAVTPITSGLPDQKVNALLPDGRGGLWVGTDDGLVRWDGHEITKSGVPGSLEKARVLAMAHDRDSNLWVGTVSGGLVRVDAQGAASSDHVGGLAHETVTAVFEDREGDLWVGTNRGVERLRDGSFTSYSASQGLPSEDVGPVYVDPDGRTWFAPARGGLYWLRGRTISEVAAGGLRQDVVYSIAGGPGEVWVGRQSGGLTRLRGEEGGLVADRFTRSDGLAQNSVYAVCRARNGVVWAGTLSGGVSSFEHGRFSTYTVEDGLASNTVTSILDDARGGVWFGTPNGVSVLSPGGWRHFGVADGLLSNDVTTLFQDSSGLVWIGTSAGLSVVRGARVLRLPKAPALTQASILGLVEDRFGWLWIATADHVLRLDRQRLLAGTLGDGDVRQYEVVDGLLGTEGVKRHRSLVADSQGRIWVSTGPGLSMADPVRIARGSVPAFSKIEQITADGDPVDLRGRVVVPAASRRIILSYAAPSLSIPGRVLFRYRLDGFDHDWSAPVAAREAVYTNLGPGPYVFRVRASNGDGLWNGRDSVTPFEVLPTFSQTAWFRLSALASLLMAGLGVYRARVRQVARRLNVRFEERLAERTRIAQELHDTLLQGFLSASMQLHVAAERLPSDSEAKSSIGKILDLMARVIDEGRRAVSGLRGSGAESEELDQAFSGIHREFDAVAAADYRVIVEGRPRPLDPITRDEVYRIGREAVVNAFRHSEAASIEVEIEYAPQHLRVVVRDDGRGVVSDVLRTGSAGHWGLTGMRERADRIGARLKVWSGAAAGTEVELLVPARVAYRATNRTVGWAARARRLWRRRAPKDSLPRSG
jgi:ligand-binding sensor domain-containing protein